MWFSRAGRCLVDPSRVRLEIIRCSACLVLPQGMQALWRTQRRAERLEANVLLRPVAQAFSWRVCSSSFRQASSVRISMEEREYSPNVCRPFEAIHWPCMTSLHPFKVIIHLLHIIVAQVTLPKRRSSAGCGLSREMGFFTFVLELTFALGLRLLLTRSQTVFDSH